MATLLARRAGAENPIATNDVHQEVMTADPSIPQFPSTGSFSSGGNFGGSNFGGGFGSSAMTAPVTGQVPQQQINLTGAGDNAATGADVLVKNDNTDWINKKWRPAMGWAYMLTCITDFVIFPVLWSVLQALSKGQVTSQWQPVTLMGAGLYHVAMGAIIGVTAYGRTKEKIAEKQ